MTRHNLQNLYKAKIIKRYLLNKKGSNKKTYHIVFSIKESNMRYAPGDCLGVMPENDPNIVDLCIKNMRAKKSDVVIHKRTKKTFSLQEFLLKKANITQIKPKLLELFQKHTLTKKIKKIKKTKKQKLTFL